VTSFVGALLGAAAGSGIFTALIGYMGTPSWTDKNSAMSLRKLRGLIAPLAIRSAIAVTGLIATVVLTGWPVAGLIVGVAGFSAPTVLGAKARRDREVDRMAALATWVEMVRDTISAASGLIETLKATAATAPAAIRPQVQQLAARAEREPLPDALAKFADEVDHGVADTIAVTLRLAAANQTGSLQEALAELAENTRQEVSMRLRIEASRARQFTSARFIAGVVAVFSVGMVGFSQPYLTPYDTAWGQVALIVIGGLFIGSAIALVKMSQFNSPPRILDVRHTAVTPGTAGGGY
jgi:signal transduction histidine kinase